MTITVPTLIAAAALTAGAFSVAAAAPGNANGDGHNGTWAVELVTESGLCSARYNYAVAIHDGEVRPISAADGAKVSGRVSADGTVGITVAGAGGSGTGTGRLTGGRGAGTWAVSPICTGRWTARRGDNRTAQAE
ncbi:hypothetical protein [Methylobacterium persicinum]|uniref:Large exoprotein involved in heme utilization or adhesion n=1 Tax=Methylobacterium persicinum TaxID=374426 RepID=A0ABU0HK91_9HYPH|nr:hypothetical protein [Methylobacterium persicinum]MDQ0442135.1 hypothetical protein [Methylobacterium persicinum]GJE38766.1 hypothetical protein KHHGKMAE_2841 [Methylobacterium persicinum]